MFRAIRQEKRSRRSAVRFHRHPSTPRIRKGGRRGVGEPGGGGTAHKHGHLSPYNKRAKELIRGKEDEERKACLRQPRKKGCLADKKGYRRLVLKRLGKRMKKGRILRAAGRLLGGF